MEICISADGAGYVIGLALALRVEEAQEVLPHLAPGSKAGR